VPEDIQQRVLRAFQEEHREHISGIRNILTGWPALSREAMDEMLRMAHSMKGGARVCDLEVVEKLTHYLEQMFADLVKSGQTGTDLQQRRVENILAAVEDYMEALSQRQKPEVPETLFHDLGITPPSSGYESEAFDVTEVETTPTKSSKQDTLRMSASHLDRLLHSSSLVLTQAMQQHDVGLGLNDIAQSVDQLQQQCDAIRSRGALALSPKEAGPGTMHDLQRNISKLGRVIRELKTRQQQGTRALQVLASQLQQNVRGARMVPASSILEGFPKMVRDLAKAEGKDVAFKSSGLEGNVDRLVLQSLKDPIMHALRNAVTHGIELPRTRERKGKTSQGTIELFMQITGNHVKLRILDDGRGLDDDFIRQRSIEAGLLNEDEVKLLSAEEIRMLVFRPGFSTRRSTTSLAGRGMGLSVVREAVNQLQGAVGIRSRLSGGTELEINAPLSAATYRLLLVQAGGQSFAIPINAISHLRRIAVSSVEMLNNRATVWLDGEPVLLASLSDALELKDAELGSDAGYLRVVVISIGTRKLAVGVDDLDREIDAMLMSLPYPASESPYFSGGVIMEDGNVALVVNCSELLDQFRGRKLQYAEQTPKSEFLPGAPVVLIVDDSFTARTLQKNILESEGYEVKIAVDGLQALAALRTSKCDVVVSDIQMPNMDGFELLAAMKLDAKLKELPVILVTSLNSEEDQTKGLSLGADAYIVKQKFDHGELLATVRQLV